MALGFGKQTKKNAQATSSTSHRGGRQKDMRPPSMRSPALESVERQGGRAATGKRPAISTGKVRYAAEETLAGPALPRKSLPRSKGKNTSAVRPSSQQQQHSGLTAGWKLQALWQPAEPALQVISEEEQQKLAALEMETRMPRIAGKIDSWLLILVLTLLCIGLVMVYSSSSFVAAHTYGDASYFFQRQMFAVIMVLMLPLLIIVLKFGRTAYGASRWLTFGSFFAFQPSELTKLALALYIADWLARKGNKVGSFLYGLIPFILLVGLILGLVLWENDMGTAIIIAGFATVMFFTAGANIVQFLLAMACGGLFFVKEAFQGYRYVRLIGFLNPFQYIADINLQLYQSLLGLGSGGGLGLGLGASRQKTGYLPFPFNDSIFAVLGEELGFIGCGAIIILFLFLAFRGFRLARRTQDIYGALLATGITTWLIVQAMLNIGSSTDSIPYTGVPLPFISFGGSSLVISLAAVGVLLNISRYIQEPENPALSRSITLNIGKKKRD